MFLINTIRRIKFHENHYCSNGLHPSSLNKMTIKRQQSNFLTYIIRIHVKCELHIFLKGSDLKMWCLCHIIFHFKHFSKHVRFILLRLMSVMKHQNHSIWWISVQQMQPYLKSVQRKRHVTFIRHALEYHWFITVLVTRTASLKYVRLETKLQVWLNKKMSWTNYINY